VEAQAGRGSPRNHRFLQPLHQQSALSDRVGQNGVLAQPVIEFREPQAPGFVQTDQEGKGLDIVGLQLISVYSQECCHCCHCDPFVPVNERMILRQTLLQRRGFLDDVDILAAQRSGQGRFERTTIPDAERTSELGDQPSVDGDHLAQY
jgi:hypothetical protein